MVRGTGWLGVHQMTTQSTSVPTWWAGTEGEWMFFAALLELGLQPNQDFTYNPEGRYDLDATFIFADPPNLAVNIHQDSYNGALGSDVRSQEIFMREALAGQGITLIFVDEDQLRQDAVGIARQALEFRDRSRLGGR